MDLWSSDAVATTLITFGRFIGCSRIPTCLILGFLNEQYKMSEAHAVSADGSVIVGKSQTGANTAGGFIWTAGSNTMQPLNCLSSGSNGEACALSADGNVVVGWSDYVSGGQTHTQAVRWLFSLPKQKLRRAF